MMSVRRWVVALACVAALVGAACGRDPASGNQDGGSGAVAVTAANLAYSPTEISVEPGATVELTFTNDDDTQHSFTADDLGVDLVVNGGDSQSTTFTAPDSGSVEFHCKFHDTMTGTITTGTGTGSSGSDNSDDNLDY